MRIFVDNLAGAAQSSFDLCVGGLPIASSGTDGGGGSQGFQGGVGPQGPAGGAQGAQGAQGPQGPQGPQGFQGDLGTQGFQGDDATGGVTLDQAYDFGGPGAGRTILVDSGAVELTGSGTTVGGFTVNGARTIASAAAAVWDEVLIDANVSLSGATNVTTATGFNMVTFNAPTITDAGTITSVTNAATLYIEGPPVGSGVTITNAYAIWVDAGNIRNDGVFLASAANPAYSFELDQDTGLRNAAANEISFVNGGLETFRVAGTLPSNNANYIFTQPASTSGSRQGLRYTASANTNQTASTETIDILWNLTATMQHATGAIATQRSFVVQARTYSFVGASTITTAATVAIEGPPIAGTNATITNSYAFWVQSGNALFAGDVNISGKLTVVGAIDPTSVLLSGGTALYYESNDGSTAPVSGAATGRIRYNNAAAAWQVSVQGGAYVSLTTGAGGGSLDTAYDFGGAGAGRTITVDSGAVQLTGGGTTVGGFTVNGTRTIASAANAVWNEVLIDADVSLSGTTNVTNLTGFNMVTFNAPVITDAGTITSVTNSATLYISGAPTGSAISITNPYAIWVDTGEVRFDGLITGGTNATFGGTVDANKITVDSNGAANDPDYGFDLDGDTGMYNPSENKLAFTTGSDSKLLIGAQNAIIYTFTPPNNTTGSFTGFLYQGPASTTQTAGVEVLDVDWDLDATLQHASGALATQRSFLIRNRTYSFNGASTITTAATLAIAGAPIAGTNATITNSYALWVQGGRSQFDGIIGLSVDNGIVSTNQTSAAGAGAGTLGNAPHAGDPDFWKREVVNGTNVAIPCWNV